MEKKQDYCNNCGNYGHLYKNCRHPILSYGIILYNTNDIPKIIMIERKDTLSYIEFLRGKYKSINDIEYLKLLFSRFSFNELEKLKEMDFDSLWNDLWIHFDTINPRIRREYKKSKDKFNLLKKGIKVGDSKIDLLYLINEVEDPYQSNEWEIPKGRRKLYENNRQCAIREFYEETNICGDDYTLFKNIIPIIEEYTGINGVKYKHVYYIGRIEDKCPVSVNMKNKDQYTEIKDIQWYSRQECLDSIRDYDEKKKEVINRFFNFLNGYKDIITIEDNS